MGGRGASSGFYKLDGKSFMDRYDELLTCDFVEYVAD